VSPKSPKPANAERRLAALCIELPLPPTRSAPTLKVFKRATCFISVAFCRSSGHEPKFMGRLGREYNVEQGREAARIAALTYSPREKTTWARSIK